MYASHVYYESFWLQIKKGLIVQKVKVQLCRAMFPGDSQKLFSFRVNRKIKFEVLNSFLKLNKVLLIESSRKQTFYGFSECC